MSLSPAPPGHRLLAAAVDSAFVLGIVWISILREQATPFDGLFTFLGFGVAGVSWLVRDTGGASPGKRLTGLRVERTDGETVGTKTSVRRNAWVGAGLILNGAGTLYIADPGGQALATFSMILGSLSGLAALADGVSLFVGGDGRRISERWARTQVVRARTK